MKRRFDIYIPRVVFKITGILLKVRYDLFMKYCAEDSGVLVESFPEPRIIDLRDKTVLKLRKFYANKNI